MLSTMISNGYHFSVLLLAFSFFAGAWARYPPWDQPASSPTLTANGCPRPRATGSSGFNVDYWHWKLNDNSVDTDQQILVDGFRRYGPYLDGSGKQLTASGISGSDINFDNYHSGSTFSERHGRVYGNYVTDTNFAMNMSAFYFPPVTGTYKFHFTADDGIGFRLGNGGSCCGSVSEIIGSELQVNTFGANGNFASGKGTYRTHDVFIYLDSDFMYPIEMVFINYYQAALLSVTVQTPQSDSYGPLEDVYQVNANNEYCAETTITAPWTQTFTSTYFTEITESATTKGELIYRPPTLYGQTTTVGYTGIQPTTVSTDDVITSYDHTYTLADVTVETPTQLSGESTTIPWTGTFPTTISTDKIITTYGNTYTVPDVTVETTTFSPTGETTTIPGASPTTISTDDVFTLSSHTYTVPDVMIETTTFSPTGETTTIPGASPTTISTNEVVVETTTFSPTGETTTIPGALPTTISTNEVFNISSNTYTVPDVVVETTTFSPTGETTTIPGALPTTISTNDVLTLSSHTYTVPDVTVETTTFSPKGETTTVPGASPATITTDEVFTLSSHTYTVPDVIIRATTGLPSTRKSSALPSSSIPSSTHSTMASTSSGVETTSLSSIPRRISSSWNDGLSESSRRTQWPSSGNFTYRMPSLSPKTRTPSVDIYTSKTGHESYSISSVITTSTYYSASETIPENRARSSAIITSNQERSSGSPHSSSRSEPIQSIPSSGAIASVSSSMPIILGTSSVTSNLVSPTSQVTEGSNRSPSQSTGSTQVTGASQTIESNIQKLSHIGSPIQGTTAAQGDESSRFSTSSSDNSKQGSPAAQATENNTSSPNHSGSPTQVSPTALETESGSSLPLSTSGPRHVSSAAQGRESTAPALSNSGSHVKPSGRLFVTAFVVPIIALAIF